MAFPESTGTARRSAWLVVIPVVVAAVVALVLSLMSTSHYRSSAEVLIAVTDDGVERVVATELAVASGSELLAEVRAVVGDEPELSVDAPGDADVLQFTATSTNADNAALAANVYADTYVAGTPGTEVVDRAVAPTDPYEPDVVRSVLLAALGRPGDRRGRRTDRGLARRHDQVRTSAHQGHGGGEPRGDPEASAGRGPPRRRGGPARSQLRSSPRPTAPCGRCSTSSRRSVRSRWCS